MASRSCSQRLPSLPPYADIATARTPTNPVAPFWRPRPRDRLTLRGWLAGANCRKKIKGTPRRRFDSRRLATSRVAEEVVSLGPDRDKRDVQNLNHNAKRRGASVAVLNPHVSTRGEMGHVVLTVLGMVAQMERRLIKKRQREGIERAKAMGAYLGGKRRINRARVEQRRLKEMDRQPSLKRSAVRGCKCTACYVTKE